MIDLLNREHPQYRARRGMWQRYYDFYAGGEKLRANAGAYLVRRQKEPVEVYQERLARAFYENYLGSIIDWYAATLFRIEPLITFRGPADFFPEFLKDCDLQGGSFLEFCRRAFIHALVYQQSYVLIDFPRVTAAAATRAEEDALGKSRAYLVSYVPEDLINWRVDQRGSLEWVVLKTESSYQAGQESGPSFTVRAKVPAGSSTNSVTLNGLSFTAGTASFSVYRGALPTRLQRIGTAQAVASQFTDTGLDPELVASPDPRYDHANFYWRLEEIEEKFATIIGPDAVGDTSLTMEPGKLVGHLVRLVEGQGAGQERTILANTATTVTVARAWDELPDAATHFVVSEAAWHFGGRVGNYMQFTDAGQRTLYGGQLNFQIEGILGILDDAAPPLSAQETFSIRDVYATVKAPPEAAGIAVRVRQGEEVVAECTIGDGQTVSTAVNGAELPVLTAGATLSLDILAVGTSYPGRDLTVTIRL